MRALAAQGRQAEALRAYQEHYRYLADELGTQPSAELVELERQIASGWHDRAPQPSRPTLCTNLPSLLTSFVGRADEMAQLRAVLGDHRLVTLVGPGGIGKTRLAVEVATTMTDRFPDGVWLVELAPLGDPTGVPQVIASTLAAPVTAHRTLTDDIVAFLRPQAALVILDNCEHVVDAAASVAVAIASGCPNVTLLGTSREGLAIAGERVWPVAPLDTGSAATQLFADRASEVASRFDPDDHRDAVEEICRRLDGLPLAIELAAAGSRASLLRTSFACSTIDSGCSVWGGGPPWNGIARCGPPSSGRMTFWPRASNSCSTACRCSAGGSTSKRRRRSRAAPRWTPSLSSTGWSVSWSNPWWWSRTGVRAGGTGCSKRCASSVSNASRRKVPRP
jgi:hypothetical protein